MKKQTLHHIIMGLLTVLSGYLYGLANSTENRPTVLIKSFPELNCKFEEQHALKYLNDLRMGAGLIPLKSNKILSHASKNHANYLIINHKIGHLEEETRMGYSGKFASNRTVGVGYHTPLLIENVSSNNHSYKESINGLMAAIYHRFAFLDFRINEIGIGVDQNQHRLAETAYVYNLGNSHLNELCKNASINEDIHSIQNICANKHLKIEDKLFYQALNHNNNQNSSIIIYPFDKQKGVTPAFYEELPDPLPDHSVSGFPISIAFNTSIFKDIKIQSFKLFNQEEEEIEESIYFTKENDPNKMLKKFEFVLFPLKRLEWNKQYYVKVIYLEKGTLKEKEWSFKTENFKQPFHTVEANKIYRIKKGVENIFYFPPLSKRDVLGNLTYPSFLDISFIDKNTIKLIAYKIPNKPITLRLGKHTLKLLIKN